MTTTDNNNNRNFFRNLEDRARALERNRDTFGIGAGGGGNTNGAGAGAGGGGSFTDPNHTHANTWGLSTTATSLIDSWDLLTNHNHNTTTTTWTTSTAAINTQGLFYPRQQHPRSGGPIFYESKLETPLERIKREKRDAYRELKRKKQEVRLQYVKWKQENTRRPQDQLNTKWGSHRHQPWSIEGRLLSAIAAGINLKTKTTEYSPATNKVYLFGHEIARLSPETTEVVSVTYPDAITTNKDINLFRLRLRQLGQICKVYRNRTELHLSPKEKQVLLPGSTFLIPIYQRRRSVPEGYVDDTVIPTVVEPKQLELEFEEKVPLSPGPFLQHRAKLGEYGGYILEYLQYYEMIDNTYKLQITAWPKTSLDTAHLPPFVVQQVIEDFTLMSVTDIADYFHAVRSNLIETMHREIDKKKEEMRTISLRGLTAREISYDR